MDYTFINKNKKMYSTFYKGKTFKTTSKLDILNIAIVTYVTYL